MSKYHDLMVKVLDHFPYLKFDKSHPWHLLLIALYCSIVEYSDTLIKLDKDKKDVAIPLVTRALLEGFVDLKNLAEDKSYGFHMEASFLHEWLKITKEADNRNNKFLGELADLDVFHNQKTMWEGEYDSLKEKEITQLSHFEKFRRAGMEDVYRSIYNFLCSHSHNNKRALTDRYIVLNENHTDFEVAMFREPHENDNRYYLEVGQEYLKLASQLIHEALETGYESAFKYT